MHARCLWLLVVASSLASLQACNEPVTSEPDLGEDPIKINEHPTGSITVPSLCDRLAVDTRVSTNGVASFAVSWANDHYEVVFSGLVQQDIFVVHLSRTGQMLDAPLAVEQTSTPSSLPTIVSTKTGYVVAWQEEDPAAPHVRTHALDLSGRPVGQGHVVAYGRSPQMRPVLAQSPLGVAISWMDRVSDPTARTDSIGDSTTYVGVLDDTLRLRKDLMSQRVNPDSKSGYPWLAGDTSTLSLLWSDDLDGRTDTYFSAIDNRLGIAHATNIRGTDAANAALLGRLALTDVGYVAAWEDLRSGEAEIYMSMLDTAGNRYAGGLVEEPGTGNANWPHIAWTGSSAGVTYYQFRGGHPQIFLTFVDTNGVRIANAADAQISNTPASARFPDLVWNGEEFGVLWIDVRDGQPEIYFNRAACQKPAPI